MSRSEYPFWNAPEKGMPLYSVALPGSKDLAPCAGSIVLPKRTLNLKRRNEGVRDSLKVQLERQELLKFAAVLKSRRPLRPVRLSLVQASLWPAMFAMFDLQVKSSPCGLQLPSQTKMHVLCLCRKVKQLLFEYVRNEY